LEDEMVLVKEHFVGKVQKVKMQDPEDEFQIGLNEGKLLCSEECQK
jgi:hypothetical protein